MNDISIKRLPVEEMDHGSQTRLDQFVETHDGTVFHETALNRFASEAYGTRFYYFLAHKGRELIGCMPCHSFRGKFVVESHSNLSSYELPYGGWVYDSDKVNIGELISKTPVGILEALHIKSNIETEPGSQSAIGKHPMAPLKTILVELAGYSNDELFNNMKHSQKQKIRRAKKLGSESVIIEPADFSIFLDLLIELKEKAGLRHRDADFYRQVYTHYHSLGRAACTAVKHRDEYISAGLMLANRNYTVGWLAGRRIGIPNNLYQNELLIWDQIKWANDFGSKYFDLGAIDEARLPHLMRMKLSFSKKTANFYSYSLRNIPYRIVKLLQGCIS